VIVGIFVFAAVFAINSSIHSYLAVKYSAHDKVAMDIGFYYMSNSAGRLLGTLVGGALFGFLDNYRVGFAACFWLSLALTLVAAAITPFLKDEAGGLSCGPCLTCIGGGDTSSSSSQGVGIGDGDASPRAAASGP
jgi:MFS family permease